MDSPNPPSPSLQGQPGELRMTLQITRAATGKTETVEVTCTPLPIPEDTHVSDPQHGG